MRSKASSTVMPAFQPWPAIVQPEELNDSFDIVLAAEVIRNPSGFGMYVVQICPRCGNQFLTNSHRKRQIRHAVSMQMTDLALSHMEKNHSTAIRLRGDSRP